MDKEGSRKREREGGRYRIWTKREAGRERGREEGIGYGQRGKQEEREREGGRYRIWTKREAGREREGGRKV